MACTTTTNLNTRMHAIPKTELSQLYQDAVLVTRKLGLQYLWIDSLCILQDSRGDWERESVLMGQVFGNSDITISAVAAEDGSSGFLGPRNTHVVRTKYRTHRGQPSEGYMYFRRQANLPAVYYVLNKRAWIIQERVLAPRILTFTKDKVFWECREMTARETGEQHAAVEHTSQNIIPMLQDLFAGGTDTSKIQLYAAWRQLVREASEAGLTYESDRLHAIASIAQLIQSSLQTEYICGTWIDDLALEMEWYPRSTCRRPAVARAPSWCWSSLEGPIHFGLHNDLTRCIVHFENLHRSLPTLTIDHPSDSPLRSPEPSWALHVRAHVAICEVALKTVYWNHDSGLQLISPEYEDFNSAAKAGGLATFNEMGQLICISFFDLQPKAPWVSRYICMLLFEDDDTRWGSPRSRYGMGLLLTTTTKPEDAYHTYTRVGTVHFGKTGLDYLLTCDTQCVTLL